MIGKVNLINVPQIILIPDAPVANNFSYTVLDDNNKLILIQFTLATDANVATRRVGVFISDGTNFIKSFFEDIGQVASNTTSYLFCVGNSVTSTVHPFTPITKIPPFVLNTGWKIECEIVNIQAGDAVTFARFVSHK